MNIESLNTRFAAENPIFSVEFFPPKTDDVAEAMLKTASRIRRFNPDFVSITYGAGGGTRDRTLRYAQRLKEEFGFTVMPHLTCVGHSRDELKEIIDEFRSSGLRQIMALRGDPPKGQKDFKPHPDGLSYANELVDMIREIFPECALGVAGYPEKHPEAPSDDVDLVNLKRKVDAGAHFITTQLFFENALYYRFVQNCQQGGITIPVLPGLMSITSRDQAKRFCDMCGATIPEALDEQLLAAGDDKDEVERIGVEWTYNQATELLEKGAPGLHLYILNKARPAIRLLERLQADGFYTHKPSPENALA